MATETEAARFQRRKMVRRETYHMLRRGGLIGAEELTLLGRAEGLSDHDIRRLVRKWGQRRWPRK